MSETNKTFLYDVKVINKEGKVLRRYSEKTAKEIEKLKTELSNDESVKYMPVGYR